MTLLSGSAPIERKRTKSMTVLRFLRYTIYSTADLLGQRMALNHPSGTLRTLKAIEEARLITHADFAEMGGRLTLWGITSAGQTHATQDGEDPITSVFNPSKISSATLSHYLDMQRIHIIGEQHGWRNWIYMDRYRRKNLAENKDRASAVRPDLLAIHPQGHKAAIEYERTLKSAGRYQTEIIPGHIRNMNANEYDFVLWITSSEEKQKQLVATITEAVEDLRRQSKLGMTRPGASYSRFQFANLTTWPKQ